MKSEYIPRPIDTSDVLLPEGLEQLTEQLAKNVHEVWSQSRLSQGWTFGEKRDDALKLHPCLVPYEELPDIEQQYDRDTAISTLKLISKLGYDIVRRPHESTQNESH